MNKVRLVWEDKHGEQEFESDSWEGAFLAMFKELDERGDYEACPLVGIQQSLYEQAREGDGKAAIRLLTIRKTYEYEGWHKEP
jgi:hypothetical protein